MITVRRSDAGSADGSTGPDDDSLSDEDLRSEIELVAELVIAVSGREERLSQPEIDRILGVEPA